MENVALKELIAVKIQFNELHAIKRKNKKEKSKKLTTIIIIRMLH